MKAGDDEFLPEIPVNSKSLASHLSRSAGYVAAMKAGGYSFTHGTRTLLSDALRWLADPPEFRVTGYRRNAPGFKKRRSSGS
ncbi:MAG: hypothetical protein ACJ8JD_01060 [Chthoniobacterales bacterium]